MQTAGYPDRRIKMNENPNCIWPRLWHHELLQFMSAPHLKPVHWILLLAVALATGAGCLRLFHSPEAEALSEDVVPEFVGPEIVLHPGQLLTYPTAQTRLEDMEDPEVFMPPASGRVESAVYGSARTRKTGGLYLAAFHEGVDIAPLERDSKGRALDPVFAVAEGRVGYISRRAGNSSYGIYVVVLHEDRAGEYYTLYAHLASVPDALKNGDSVARGAEIGRMGNSSTLGIPVQRSHLHFEFGTMLNSRFDKWLRSNKMTQTHGLMHGWNLAGLNPAELFSFMKDETSFVFESCILAVPVAFRMVVQAEEKPDYYCRYPSLWSGDEPAGAIVMDVSQSGVPLRAGPATPGEIELLGRSKMHVLEAFPDVLGRNGKRLVVSKGDRWIPGRNAAQWLDILLY
jgi:hypothetical protein